MKERAARLIGSGQLERAEVVLRQALTQAPRDVSSWLKHAEVLKRLSRTPAAVSSYRLAARILDDDGHHHRAVAALKLALAMLPEDVDLYAEIIRCELRARKTSAGMRAMFPLSSPSQILGASSGDSGLFPLSTTAARLDDLPPKQLALPMSTSATVSAPRTRSAEHRSETWLPDPTPPAPLPPPSAEAHAPSPPPTAAPPPGLDTMPLPFPSPLPTRPAAPEPESSSSEVPPPRASAPLRFEVSWEERWPQVIRLSDQKIAVRHAPGARWVVVEGPATLTVSFEPFLEIPEDAEWLE